MDGMFQLWVYLSASPLLWLTVTLGAYVLADRIALVARYAPIANPVLIAVALIALLLHLTRTGYPTLFRGARSSCTSCSGRRRWRWRCRWCGRRRGCGG